MNNNIININNYEAFLLDKIEGNLSVALVKELDEFLINNGLEDVNESDLVFLDENELQNPMTDLYLMSEDLKRFQPSLSEEKIIFEAVEGNIEEEVESKFKTWLASDVILNQHYQAMLATRSSIESDLVYPHKSQLKRREPIVKYLYFLAAACFLGVLVMFGFNKLKDQNPEKHFTQNETKNEVKKSDEEILNIEQIIIADAPVQNPISAENNVNETSVNAGKNNFVKSKGSNQNQDVSKNANDNNQVLVKNTIPEERLVKAPVVKEVSDARNKLNTVPKIARLGSDRVVSNIPKSATVNIYQNKKVNEEDVATGPINSIRDKIEYLDRKSAAIYGFADYQKNIIKSEGLLEVSKDRNTDGKVEGYSLRIAGFELSTAR